MPRKIFLLMFYLLILNSCAKEVAEGLNLKLVPPQNWTEKSEKEIFKQIYKKGADDKLKQSREINKNFRVLKSYLKYGDPNHLGIIPTIQIQIHDNHDKYIKNFERTVSKKVQWMIDNLDGYELLASPKKENVDGVAVVHFSIVHNQVIDGITAKIRSHIYMIPNGNTLYQLTFNDYEGDDCSKEFEEAIKSIKLFH